MSFYIVILLKDNKSFFDEGFSKPNYFLPIGDNKTLIEYAIEKQNSNNLIFILQKEHCEKYNTHIFLKEKYPNAIFHESIDTIDKPFIILDYEEIVENDKHYSIKTPEQYYNYLQDKYGSVKSKDTLDNMKRGWLVGNFTPSILRTDVFEVAYMRHKKGEYWPPHVHNEISEYNVLIRGTMKMNNELINQGEIFNIPKKMLTHAVFLEDCEVLCIKTPSIPSDKSCF
jgi:mannose-6-phosphate isomerase-like protein (cupin superfamily)